MPHTETPAALKGSENRAELRTCGLGANGSLPCLRFSCRVCLEFVELRYIQIYTDKNINTYIHINIRVCTLCL